MRCRDRHGYHCLTSSDIDLAGAIYVAGACVGAALMITGGIIAIFLGVHAERESLENIAKPLTAEDSSDESGQSDQQTAPTPA